MPAFAARSTTDLIALLFAREELVNLELIEELARRGPEAAAPLRAIINDQDYWYEGADGNYWILVHAVMILSLMRDREALPELIERLPHAYFSNHDDVVNILPEALGLYGAEAVEPLIKFIGEYRRAFKDNPDYSHCRHDVMTGLARIALRDESVRQRVADFVCGVFEDPEEDDDVFLSFSAPYPVALAGDRGLMALHAAHERGMINPAINGVFEEFIELLDDPKSEVFRELEDDPFDFYHPESIAERKREKDRIEWEAAKKTLPNIYQTSGRGPVVREEKVGRNDPCPCGSGKKFKKCCGQAAPGN